MNGTLVWAILGSLIGVVLIFLVITSIFDKKKRAKLKIQKKQIGDEIIISTNSTFKKIQKIIKNNQENLEKFVVSVGKMKMFDINNNAKNNLLKIKNSREFKLIKNDENIFDELEKNISNLISEKSNMWEKRCNKNIEYFNNFVFLKLNNDPIVKEKRKK